MIKNIKRKIKTFTIQNILLKLNHIVFWWYYKRVPKFFHQWTILKSIRLLKENYEHALFHIKGLNEVINGSIKRESEMKNEISNMKLTIMGITQDKIDPINKIFGTNLKGKSTQARDN